MECFYTALSGRGLIEVSGKDARGFLQGLISNDMEKTSPGKAVYAAFLTAQGKFLHDLFVIEKPDGAFLIDCEKARLADLLKRLSLYKLRSAVTLREVTDLKIFALWGGEPLGKTELLYPDPRCADAGWRAMAADDSWLDSATETDFEAYDYHRATLGLPDGSRDLEIERAVLLENGFDELNGVDWEKGCYLGQELTARTKYRGLVRKRLLPCLLPGGGVLKFGDKVSAVSDGKTEEAGEIRSFVPGESGRPPVALALLRLEMLDKKIVSGDVELKPYFPKWYRAQE